MIPVTSSDSRCLAVRGFVALLAVAVVSATRPPVQSALQRRARNDAIAPAALLSQRAEPELLALFDAPAFRTAIAALSIAQLPAAELLALYQQQVRLSPITHNLPAESFPFLFNATYMLNDWEAGVSYADSSVEEYIETHVFPDFPAFSNNSCLPQDCRERPKYFILNSWGWANGLFIFGDVSMVLKPAYGRNLTVMLPMDTGIYAEVCANVSTTPPAAPSPRRASRGQFPPTEGSAYSEGSGDSGGPRLQCDAWSNFSAGTLEHFNHVTLDGLRLWANPEFFGTAAQLLGAQFLRMFSPVGGHGPLPSPRRDEGYMMTYIEVMAVGAVLLPEGVSYVVAQFSPLFGTATGARLVAWAKSLGIGVAWAPGQAPEGGSASAHYPLPSSAQLFLDPTVPFVPNASASVPNARRRPLRVPGCVGARRPLAAGLGGLVGKGVGQALPASRAGAASAQPAAGALPRHRRVLRRGRRHAVPVHDGALIIL